MQFLGIGPLEFILILVIAVIILGPKGLVSGAREAGKLIRKLIHSPLWREIMDTSNEIRDLPRKIVREAGIEKDLQDLSRSTHGTIREINQSQLPKITPIIGKTRDETTPEEPGNEKEKDGS